MPQQRLEAVCLHPLSHEVCREEQHWYGKWKYELVNYVELWGSGGRQYPDVGQKHPKEGGTQRPRELLPDL